MFLVTSNNYINYEKIESHPEKVSDIIPFINN